ncbi:MAG: DUF4012 domain-containing protein [Jatrophihabitans sp.]|uniref:DUF4012 domain-containing protein n=1 Tax=Jatrophihabitans sp. TaxID=1932789 RepID=UPI00390DC1DF
MRSRVRYLRYHRRPIRIGLLAAGLLAGLGLVWIAITAYLARQQTRELDNRLQEVRMLIADGRVDDARTLAKGIPAVADRAHQLTSGPAWWFGAHLPWVGDPLEVARGTTLAGAQVGSTALPKLLSVADALNPTTLRASGDTIKLAPLVRAVPTLQQAARDIDSASALLASLPHSTWIGPVDSGRAKFASDLDIIRGYTDAAARVAEVLPTMLGRERSQTYFIGLQNEAELRGTGGLPGAFAIARASHGTLKFTRFESDAVLEPAATNQEIRTGLSFGAGYDSAYGPSLPTNTFVDSNVSPHFPYAARIWQAMWKKVSGQQVDGVLALDPTALSYFLAVTGPAGLSGGGTISAANVVTLTQRDEYVLFNDNIKRKQFIVSVLRAASKKIISGSGNGLSIVQAASRSATEQRLLAWSDDPHVESVLERSHFAGAIPQGNHPFAGLVVNNAAAGKLDFYLTRSITYERTGCGPTRDSLVTIKLTNNAPAGGLPLYVVGRADHPPPTARPGDNHSIVDFYATAGSQLNSVTLNGRPSTAAVEHDLGHPIFRFDLEIPRGTTQTLAVHLQEPAGQGATRIWRQPGVAPLAVQKYEQNCG